MKTDLEILTELLQDQEGRTWQPETVHKLERLLSRSEEARELWVDFCQLEGWLSFDEQIARELSREGLPGNVVPLPEHFAATRRTGNRADRTGVEGPSPHANEARASDSLDPTLAPAKRPRGSKEGAWLAVAALVALLILAGAYTLVERGPSIASETGTFHPGEEVLEAAEDSSAPNRSEKGAADEREADYQRMLLAEVTPGTVNRPTTPIAANPGGGGISFNRDIRPILSDHCFSCHGPDAEGRKANLRLDQELHAVFRGDQSSADAPIVAGKPDASLFMERILTDDPDDIMPPPEARKILTPDQKDLLRRWIAEGANWQEHWAFAAPQAADPPQTEEAAAWVRNPIDAFVFEKMKEQGLQPAAEADRHTLIRRLSLDLIGLPPTPDEVEAFIADEGPEAYEALVDRLLASPRYGEHRARYWLDAARYADTHGLHLDNYREIWPYRDWVVEACNENQPFDRFTIDQLAGDLLDSPSVAQQVATGFHRCNVTTSEGGAIAEEFAVRYAVDRVSTTGTVWMGLTIGCAQCHNHKYDPISQREFYELFAYFNNTTQRAMDGNAPDTPPVIRVFANEADETREGELRKALAEADQALKARGKEAEEALSQWLSSGPDSEKDLAQQLPADVRLAVDRSRTEEASPSPTLTLEADRPFTLAFQFKSPETPGEHVIASQIDGQGRGFRVTSRPQDKGVGLTLYGGEGRGALGVEQIMQVRGGGTYRIVIVNDGSATPGGIGLYVNGRLMGRNRFPYLEVDHLDGKTGTNAPLEFALPADALPWFAAWDRVLGEAEVKLIEERGRAKALLAKAAEKTPEGGDLDLLRRVYLTGFDGPYQQLLARRAGLQSELKAVHRRAPVTHVMHEKEGEAMAHELDRGEYDQKLEEVHPGVPAILPPLPEDAPANRLGLANWLVSGENPLTARVTVNRLWQQLFGVGLVRTAEDFGTQGEPPTHPALLDWLAVDFVRQGWDVKAAMKQMVMSATYRQSTEVSPDLWRRDPDNRWLARGSRHRLDAEVIRDQALALSGLLVDKIGGPGVRPYQPDGLWKTVGYSNSNTVRYYRNHGEGLYRRSVYTFWKRTAPPPNMIAFDAPDRESCVVRRERTNTPLQALVLMNDVQFVEAARVLAQHSLLENAGKDENTLISRLGFRALSRPLDDEEVTVFKSSLGDFRKHYAEHPEAAASLLEQGDFPVDESLDPAELAAVTLVANQLLNLDEVITKP